MLQLDFYKICRILLITEIITLISDIEFINTCLLKYACNLCSKQSIFPLATKRLHKNSILLNKNIMNIFLIKWNYIKNFRKRCPIKLLCFELDKWRLPIYRVLEEINLRKWVNKSKILKHDDFIHLIKPLI